MEDKCITTTTSRVWRNRIQFLTELVSFEDIQEVSSHRSQRSSTSARDQQNPGAEVRELKIMLQLQAVVTGREITDDSFLQ